MTLPEKVKNSLSKHLPSHGDVYVAVSGGSDSACLLDVIVRFNLVPKNRLVVLNFDHGIRGEESARDSAFVADRAKSYGLRLVFERFDVPAESKKRGASIETTARLLRREFFAKLRSENNVILTAHNASDRVESILMHLFRGSGLKGLVGMNESGEVLRPLLSCSKAEIMEYIGENSLPYVTDSTNLDDTYSRNFIRNRVLPLVREKYPSVDEAVLRLAENVSNTRSISEARMDGDSALITASDGETILSAFSLVGLVCDYTGKHVRAVSELFEKRCGAGVDLPHGYRAEKEKDGVRIYRNFEALNCLFSFTLGETELPLGKLVAEEVPPFVNKTETVADYYKIPDGAVIRTRRNGDKFCPIGGSEKSLSDWLIDKKIPKYKRKSLLCLASGQTVLMIIGVATGEKIKIDDKTEKAVRINLLRGR